MQIRTNAPDAYMILLITPVNVQSPIRGHVSAQMAARERVQQVQELQSQCFQKLYLLELPESVMQVCHALPSSFSYSEFYVCIAPKHVQMRRAQMTPKAVHSKSSSSSLNVKKTFSFNIPTGVMQADSLSPYWMTHTQVAHVSVEIVTGRGTYRARHGSCM